MKIYLAILVVAVSIFSYSSCQKKDLKEIPELRIDKSRVIINGNLSAIDTISIQANIEYKVTVSPSDISWLKINQTTSGNRDLILITSIEKNLTNVPRSAVIVIAPTTPVVELMEIEVIQSPLTPHLLLSKDSISFVEQTIDSFFVATNLDWKIQNIPYWLKASPSLGDSNATVVLKALPNDSNLYRHVLLTIGSTDTSIIKPSSLLVTQGIPILSASADEIFLSPDINNTGSCVITGNINWTADYNCDWLDVKRIEGKEGSDTLLFKIMKYNETSSDHHTDIFIHANSIAGFTPLLVRVIQRGERTDVHGKSIGGSMDDSARFLIRTNDQHYVMVGHSNSNDGDVSGNHGGQDGWVVKLNASYGIVWSKLYGGVSDDRLQAAANTTDGGIIVAGNSFSSGGDIASNLGYSDAWVMKLDANGNKQWSISFGGSDHDYANSIAATTDGGCIVVGHTYSIDGEFVSDLGHGNGWIMKLDQNGRKEWSKVLGGIHLDRSLSVISTSEGYVMAGWSYSFNGSWWLWGKSQGWIMKFDKLGNVLTSKFYGGEKYEAFFSIIEVADGYVAAGYMESPGSDLASSTDTTQGGWLMKVNKYGTVRWSKKYGDVGQDEFNQVINEPNGGLIAIGTLRSPAGSSLGFGGPGDFWIEKTDANGNRMSASIFGGTDIESIYSVVPKFDKGILIAGNRLNLTTTGGINRGSDAYIKSFMNF